MKASQQALREALHGHVTAKHRFLLRLHLDQIDAFDAAIAKIDAEVEASIAPFRTAVEQVATAPGVKVLAARTILSEIGSDMSLELSDAPCEAVLALPHLCRDRFHHLLDTNDIQYTG